MAGYKVIRYEEVPDYHQLREDFYGDLYASSRLTKDTRVAKNMITIMQHKLENYV